MKTLIVLASLALGVAIGWIVAGKFVGYRK